MAPGTQSALRLLPSREIPRYRLVGRIATGGMSEVFLALMSGTLGSVKPVVIKRLWPHLASDPNHVQLFADEARLSLQMAHPNVVQAFESGIDGDRHFLALEYLDGQSLKHLIESAAPEGGLSLPLALKVVCDVLMALQYVHDLSDLSGNPLHIVHRDVCPQNVFVTYDGHVKLVDFGIAQFRDSWAPPARQDKGRVVYMAPEQLAGGPVDARADLFSVGIMLWEMATGRRLWEGMNEEEIVLHLHAGLPLPSLPRNQGFPPGLAAVCAKALAPEVDQRYQSASEFLFDLGQLLTGSMPIHTGILGELMGRLFGQARALSRAMIQQALPAETSGRITREMAVTPPPHVGVVSDHSTSTTITVPGDEVTLVDVKVPLRPKDRKSSRAVRLAVGLFLGLALLEGGVLVGRSVTHIQQVQESFVGQALVTQPLSQPIPEALDEPIEPTEAAEPQGTNVSTQVSPAQPHARAHRRASAAPKLEKPGSAMPIPATRGSQNPASRPIDREDPYGP